MQEIEELLKSNKNTLTEKEKNLLRKAYDFAEKAHEGQKRDTNEPYFIHVFETAKNLIELGMSASVVAAGFLHDTIEDTEITEEDIEREFGEEITFLVKGVTKLKKIKYQGRERYVESLRKFFLAIAQDLRVVTIKLADRLHNIKTLQCTPFEKQKRVALETLEVYAPLAGRLGMGKLKGELEDAAFPYVYPKEYKEIEEILKEKKGLYEKSLAAIEKKLREELNKQKIKFVEMNSRVKTKYSLYKKLLRYNMDIDKIYDIVALRVVVESVDDCYRVLGLVHSLWSPLVGRIKDYIALPKLNGYRSLNTTIFTGDGGIAEVQIRTKEMHREASYGIAAHFAYKEEQYDKNTDPKKFKWIDELKELKYNPNEPYKFTDNLKMDFFNDRIFVFTPKGDVVDLPQDSTPIDFAYNLDLDIGNHTAGVKINGKVSSIFSGLKSGDIVEIIKTKGAHPVARWLDFIKTTVAEKHIKNYLENHSLLGRLKSFCKY